MQRFVLPLLAFCLVIAMPLAAQTDETGVLEGQVQDQNGNPIPSAEVSIRQADGSYPNLTRSDDNGTFRLGFLKPGLYEVRVRTIGYRPTNLSEVRIRAAQVTAVTVVSEATPIQLDAVTVSGATSLIDRTTQEYTSTLDGEEIAMLPISRTAVDLINFTPGARPDAVWGGSTQQANVYQLDGVNVNDPGFGGEFLLPNVDWIQEFTVKGPGTGAEYGGFQGGQINLVTRSGTNTFRPRVRFNYESTSLNATNVNAFEAGEEQDNRGEVNAEVSGPIVRDKLYYYASAQEVHIDMRVVDIENSTEDEVVFISDPSSGNLLLAEQTRRKLLGKLTWQATTRDVLNLMAGYDGLFTDNAGLNSFDSPETVTKQDSPASFYNASWQRVWNANHLTELKVTGWLGRNDFDPLFGDRPAVQLLSGNEETFRNSAFALSRDPDNLSIAANWDSYWHTGPVRHHLKIGGEYTLGWWKEGSTRGSGITWRPDDTDGAFDPEDPATWDFISSDWGGEINLDAVSTNAAVYVQDYISITPRLSVSAGLRLGYFKGKLTPGDGSGPQFKAMDHVALAPRIGATFDVLPEQGIVAKAHWGRYYQNMFALLFDRTTGGNVFTDLEFWDWIDTSLPDIDRRYTEAERATLFTFFGDVPLGQEVGPVENYSQPYMDQFVGGLEWEFARNWKASALYINRRNRNIVSLVDRNLETNYTEFANIEVFEFPSGDPVLDQDGNPLVLPRVLISNDDILFVGSAPGLTPGDVAALTFNQDLVLTVADDARRNMDQIQIAVERTIGRWALLGSVVWTDLRGNFYSVNGYDDPGGVGAGQFVRPNEGINTFGDMPNYSDWEVKLRATGSLPFNIRVGGFLTYFSGDHYTPVFAFDRRNHDYVAPAGFLDPDLIFGIDGQTVFLEERGSRMFDSRFRLDLHVDYSVPVGPARWVFALDVFNVFNSDAVTDLKTFVNNQDPSDPTTLFGAPRFRVDPRIIRITASLEVF